MGQLPGGAALARAWGIPQASSVVARLSVAPAGNAPSTTLSHQNDASNIPPTFSESSCWSWVPLTFAVCSLSTGRRSRRSAASGGTPAPCRWRCSATASASSHGYPPLVVVHALVARFQPGGVHVVPEIHRPHDGAVVLAIVGVVPAVVVVVEGQQIFHLRLLGELMAALEAGVDRGQVVGFVVDAVIRVVGVAQDHLVHPAVVGVAQHQAALPGFEARVAVHRLRVKAVVGVHLDVDRPGLDVVGFGGQRVVAVVAGVGAAGTGDARRVGLVGHHFRTTGFHLRHRRHVELHAADIKVLHPGAPAVVVHPEVVVDPLLRTLVEVAAGPDIGVGVGVEDVGDADVGLLQVNLVAPVVEHHVKIPDSPCALLKALLIWNSPPLLSLPGRPIAEAPL